MRRATASLRGAALAVAAAAATVAQQLRTGTDCAQDDVDCLSDAYADLLTHEQRMTRVRDEIERLEATPLEYEGAVPHDAPRLGWQVPSVAAARSMVDRTHDLVVEARNTARSALAGVDRGPEGALP